MHQRIPVLLGLLFLATLSQSQQPSQPAGTMTFEQLAAGVKFHFRDTAEFHVKQIVAFTATNRQGKVRKTEKVEIKYLFQGFNPNKERAIVGEGALTLGQALSVWRRRSWRLAIHSDAWTAEPIIHVLSSANAAEYNFESRRESGQMGSAALWNAVLTPVHSCATLTMTQRADYFWPDRPCGSDEFQLDSDLVLHRFIFEASGLPAPVNIYPWGKCMVTRYRAEVEYHSIVLPSDPKPFVVPKHVTTTMETDKGRILIDSAYVPDEPRLNQYFASTRLSNSK